VATSLQEISARLEQHDPLEHDVGPSTRQAAVAIILRRHAPPRTDATDMLFIRRAEKIGDPWSGHMAFPGGHKEADDGSLLDAAVRETYEEIGLDLGATARHIGTLDHQRAAPRGRTLDMLIAPFVFELTEAATFRPNYEVAEVVWTPFAPIFTATNYTTEDRIVAGEPILFGGYRVNGGHFVWGLTYRMVHSFCKVLDPAWVAPPEG
jgi:8-oxo-dGTP pyrophosphatase MutT (NUDIX family)